MYTIMSATEDFLRHCRFEKNLSSKTLKAYSSDLAQFACFLEKERLSRKLSRLDKSQIRSYLEHLSTHKPKTIKRKIASLRAMLNYLEFEERISVNPMRKVRIRIREPKELPRVMDIDEVGKLFKAAYLQYKMARTDGGFAEKYALRDVAVLELLFSLGARVSEIASLRVRDIDLKTGVVLIKGKGNKERLAQISNRKAMQAIRLCRDHFSDQLDHENSRFLRNRFGHPLSDQSIRGIVRRLAQAAGLDKTITPHMFRHTFATLLLENDVDIKYIQTLLGHSSIMTTQIYTHVNAEKQRQILRTKHPRRMISSGISRM